MATVNGVPGEYSCAGSGGAAGDHSCIRSGDESPEQSPEVGFDLESANWKKIQAASFVDQLYNKTVEN